MLNPATSQLLKALKNKTTGLYHLSDSKFPFHISAMGKGQPIMYEILKSQACENRVNTQEVIVEDYFSKVTRINSWLSKEEKESAKNYRDLLEFLKLNFVDIKILKIGEVFLDLHIIGKTKEGDYIILSTNEVIIPKHIALDY